MRENYINAVTIETASAGDVQFTRNNDKQALPKFDTSLLEKSRTIDRCIPPYLVAPQNAVKWDWIYLKDTNKKAIFKKLADLVISNRSFYVLQNVN